MSRVRELWQRIQEPRIEKVAYFCVYVGVIVLAGFTLASPPGTIADPLGPVLTLVWCWLWIVSAIIGAVVVFVGWWEVERIGLALGLFGVGIYASVVVTLHISGEGSRWAQLAVLWIAAGFYVIRLIRIWGHDYEPRTLPKT